MGTATENRGAPAWEGVLVAALSLQIEVGQRRHLFLYMGLNETSGDPWRGIALPSLTTCSCSQGMATCI